MTSFKGIMFAGLLLLAGTAAFFLVATLYAPDSDPQDSDDVVVAKLGLASDALNSCFDEKQPNTCGPQAKKLMRAARTADKRKLLKPLKADHDVYFIRFNSVVFWKSQCQDSDIGHDVYVVNIFPLSRENLPKARRAGGFNVIGFPSPKRSIRVGTDCVASVRLPKYPLNKLIVGQYNRSGAQKGFVWNETVRPWS